MKFVAKKYLALGKQKALVKPGRVLDLDPEDPEVITLVNMGALVPEKPMSKDKPKDVVKDKPEETEEAVEMKVDEPVENESPKDSLPDKEPTVEEKSEEPAKPTRQRGRRSNKDKKS